MEGNEEKSSMSVDIPPNNELDVDLGDISQTKLILTQKMEDDDDELLVPKPERRKGSSGFIKLLLLTVLLGSLLLLISSTLLSYTRRESRETGNYDDRLREWLPVRDNRRFDIPFDIQIHQELPRENIVKIIRTPNSFAAFYSGQGDNTFNFYLDTLHRLRDAFFSEFDDIQQQEELMSYNMRDNMEDTIGDDFNDVLPLPMFRLGETPAICSEFESIVCKVLVNVGNGRIAFMEPNFNKKTTPSYIGKQERNSQNSTWYLPVTGEDVSQGTKPPPTVIPAVHSEKAAAIIEKETNLKPEVIPHYCPHLAEQPGTVEPLFSTLALFPGESENFTRYFLKTADEATTNLDVATSITDLREIRKNIPAGLKAIIFPTRNIPEETLHQFYCLGIPLFVPLVDFYEMYKNKEPMMKCNETDTINEDIIHHTFYSSFQHVVHYSCMYDLIEKLHTTDLHMKRNQMWNHNSEKNKEALKKLKMLKNREIMQK